MTGHGVIIHTVSPQLNVMWNFTSFVTVAQECFIRHFCFSLMTIHDQQHDSKLTYSVVKEIIE